MLSSRKRSGLDEAAATILETTPAAAGHVRGQRRRARPGRGVCGSARRAARRARHPGEQRRHQPQHGGDHRRRARRLGQDVPGERAGRLRVEPAGLAGVDARPRRQHHQLVVNWRLCGATPPSACTTPPRPAIVHLTRILALELGARRARQRDRAGPGEDRLRPGAVGAGGRRGRAACRCVGSASPTTSRTRPASSPDPGRRGSPVTRSWSTAARSPGHAPSPNATTRCPRRVESPPCPTSRASTDSASSYLDDGDGRPVVLLHGFAADTNVNYVRSRHPRPAARRGLPRGHARRARPALVVEADTIPAAYADDAMSVT